MKCEAIMCGKCGVIHNVEDLCPFEALWDKINGGRPVIMPVGDDYTLEVRPVFDEKVAEPDKPPVIPENLKHAMMKGWMEMQLNWEAFGN